MLSIRLLERCKGSRKRPLPEPSTPAEVVEQRKRLSRVLASFYTCWQNRIPLLLLMLPPPRDTVCAAVFMINPDYFAKLDSEIAITVEVVARWRARYESLVPSWSHKVRFGRVVNADKCFAIQTKPEGLTCEEVKFCEFAVDACYHRDRIRLLESESYPVLRVTLRTNSYSIDGLERLYNFYVSRRIVKYNPRLRAVSFEMDSSPPCVRHVQKQGEW